MGKKKGLSRFIFILMALIIIVQYLATPAIVVAETIAQRTDYVQLKKLQVKQSTTQTVDAQLETQVNNQTDTEQTEAIQIDDAHILDVKQAQTLAGVSYTIKDN